MGCGLPKLEKQDENSPGKIYSTLKRPQVETSVGTSYSYCFFDFTVGKNEGIIGSSAVQLSSMKDLPQELLELYSQGFTLVAIHPFIHPAAAKQHILQGQLYRAVLSKTSDSNTESTRSPESLEIDRCLSSDRFPDIDSVEEFIKNVQDIADDGVKFIGFIQKCSSSDKNELKQGDEDYAKTEKNEKINGSSDEDKTNSVFSSDGKEQDKQIKRSSTDDISEVKDKDDDTRSAKSQSETCSIDGHLCAETGGENESEQETEKKDNSAETPNNKTEHDDEHNSKKDVQMFTLFNIPVTKQKAIKYYTDKVPLKINQKGQSFSSMEANWLDHLTQHFTNGALLVDGYFSLGADNDSSPQSTEVMFIFQESDTDTTSVQAYDAIVVEQWTTFEDSEVKTDYIPLLKSLSAYGWRLTCVLPTPIVKTNSNGNIATKQIVFLQRPFLPRKKKESRRLSFKPRNKQNKSSIKHSAVKKQKENTTIAAEKENENQIITNCITPSNKDLQENYWKANTEKENKANTKGEQQMQQEESAQDEEPESHSCVMKSKGEESSSGDCADATEVHDDDVADTAQDTCDEISAD
ncbi:raftlin-like isoform X2 [Erpetoichthys calabaricus]|uniref:raftlin-like isoform X2 n=1 Tax=Erpetoichthys calabaricus TaxID=27687 RepID=UPI00109F3C69|nr:raftlin-like isoform X2 [Erpetoichthys calabaricus]